MFLERLFTDTDEPIITDLVSQKVYPRRCGAAEFRILPCDWSLGLVLEIVRPIPDTLVKLMGWKPQNLHRVQVPIECRLAFLLVCVDDDHVVTEPRIKEVGIIL